MDNKLRGAFDKIHAETALRQKTANFLSQKIQKENGGRKNSRFRLVAICASFALLFIIGGLSHNLYMTPSAYVDLDINPSVELAVNRFGRVITANPYNEDGVTVLQEVNVDYMDYEDAVNKILDAMVTSGYLKQGGIVTATIQTENKNRETNMLVGLQVALDNTLQEHHTNAISTVFAVNKEVRSHAHENDITPAKYLAISELQTVDPTATFESCREHTISEITQMLADHDSSHQNGGKHH